MRIGVDFDNTIIRYDGVFAAAAIARKLIPEGFAGTKQDVRDAVQKLPDGERAWQALQGHVYGTAIGGAEPFPGLDGFLRRARGEGAEVIIVSHKTQYGHHDSARVDLRKAALRWLEERGFFDGELGLSRDGVHFAGTRDEKLKRIAALAPDVFIDDLPEVLDDPKFPAHVRRVLFSSRPAATEAYPSYSDWEAIEEAVFDERA